MKPHLLAAARFVHKHRHDIADALMVAAFLLRNLPDSRAALPTLKTAKGRAVAHPRLSRKK